AVDNQHQAGDRKHTVEQLPGLLAVLRDETLAPAGRHQAHRMIGQEYRQAQQQDQHGCAPCVLLLQLFFCCELSQSVLPAVSLPATEYITCALRVFWKSSSVMPRIAA